MMESSFEPQGLNDSLMRKDHIKFLREGSTNGVFFRILCILVPYSGGNG